MPLRSTNFRNRRNASWMDSPSRSTSFTTQTSFFLYRYVPAGASPNLSKTYQLTRLNSPHAKRAKTTSGKHNLPAFQKTIDFSDFRQEARDNFLHLIPSPFNRLSSPTGGPRCQVLCTTISSRTKLVDRPVNLSSSSAYGSRSPGVRNSPLRRQRRFSRQNSVKATWEKSGT